MNARARHTLTSATLAATLAFGALGAASAQDRPAKLVETPPAVAAAPAFSLPPVQERRLANGLRVIFLANNEQPVVSMSVMIRSGATSEPAEKAGLAQMTAGLVDQGTTTRTATQIAEAIDSAGGSLSASAGWDATTAGATVLSDRAGLAAELLSDVLRNPVFKQEEIDRARTQALNALQLAASDAGGVADQVFDSIIYGGSPYAHPIEGTVATIGAITRDDIVAFHKANYVPNNATLAIVGAVTAQQAFDLAEKNFGSWAKGDVAPAPAKITPKPGKVRIVVLDKPDAAQTEIRAGLAGFARNDPDYFPAVVTNTILGGAPFSSRIESELRVKRGLTYGAGSSFEARVLGGEFQIETNTKTATTVEAVDVILQQVAGLRGADVTADELRARKGFLEGVFLLSLETPDAVAGRLLQAELYELGPNYLDTYTKNVEAVTAADVRRIAQSRIQPDQFVIVLAGNAKEFADGIKKFGPVETIPFDQVDYMTPTLRRGPAADASAAPAAQVSEADAKAGMELAKKTVAALGGDAYLNMKSLVLKGSGSIVAAPGQTLTVNSVVSSAVFPDDSHAEIDLGIAKIVQGSNANEAWVVSPNGVQDITSQAKEQKQFGEDLLRRLDKGGLTARPLPDADVNGVTAKGFALRDAEGHETSFYVDPATFLPIKVSFQTSQGKTDAFLKNYKPVSGVQIPYAIEQWRNGAKYIELTYTDAQVNVDVDPALFVKPH